MYDGRNEREGERDETGEVLVMMNFKGGGVVGLDDGDDEDWGLGRVRLLVPAHYNRIA